ncbi:Protocatechuate 4,5-dioxygenase alpha chain [Candidatus Rhodobacter oscarellae]|uniref:Protocatechuate 4,5-dioxygenase alpha chain n=1 Tax=Candidatus Rhodobacter oscarellae TaxID=1675527 RepID=A0A0J9E4Y6_9RHOB|nr:protocatechuate 4,5-dioxygenase subunit alpha [Candidatus Rhodobacter lobularis]KMW57806.1 Protocatechuate 4,5-dioxygenase alpha chain [Candidatus Rhodobacter lobularis]
MAIQKDYEDIPGTFVFDADRARVGYPLNQFCISLGKQAGRDAFAADPEAYMASFGMTEEQKQAVRDRDWNAMFTVGGNVYYTAKLAANDGLSFQQLAALMTGMGHDAYREMMLNGGRPIEGNRYKSEWGEE